MSGRKADPEATPVPTTEGQMTSIFDCRVPKLTNVADKRCSLPGLSMKH